MFKRLPEAGTSPDRTTRAHTGKHVFLEWLSRTADEILPSRGLPPRTVQHRHHEERNGDSRQINRLEPAIKHDQAAFREHDPDVWTMLRRLMHAANRCVDVASRRWILPRDTSCRRNVAVSSARRTVNG